MAISKSSDGIQQPQVSSGGAFGRDPRLSPLPLQTLERHANYNDVVLVSPEVFPELSKVFSSIQEAAGFGGYRLGIVSNAAVNLTVMPDEMLVVIGEHNLAQTTFEGLGISMGEAFRALHQPIRAPGTKPLASACEASSFEDICPPQLPKSEPFRAVGSDNKRH